MGIFDSLKENAANRIEGEAAQGLGSKVFSMFGGLHNVVNLFHEKGLGDIASSWVSNGPNKPVSPDQVEHVFGSEKLQQIASQAGVSKDEVRNQLAQHLPQVVDRATPDGKLPAQAA